LHMHSPSFYKRHVGVLGGTFDPVHYGHLVIAEEVRFTLQLAEMVFIPAGHPPHKPGAIVSAAQHRLAMLELAIASNPYFSISLVDLERPGPSYTVDTLRLLREQWGEQTAIYFVIGGDSLEDLLTWHDPKGILEQLYALVAVMRPGHEDVSDYRAKLAQRLPGMDQRLVTVAAPQLDISATDLRRRVAEGRSITYQTPAAVEQYIQKHRLYRQRIEGVAKHDTDAF
jgi:nicotinate-nucleotide adenylyltransferase